MLADTDVAIFSSRTRILSSRELASPPSTDAPRSSAASCGDCSPGTAQCRWISTVGIRSFITIVFGAASVGTSACAGSFTLPRGIAPNYFSIRVRASAGVMSPDSATIALLGP